MNLSKLTRVCSHPTLRNALQAPNKKHPQTILVCERLSPKRDVETGRRLASPPTHADRTTGVGRLAISGQSAARSGQAWRNRKRGRGSGKDAVPARSPFTFGSG